MGMMVETQAGDRVIRRIEAEMINRFIVGVDLGQSSDPTAISVLHHHRDPLPRWDMTQNMPRLLEQTQQSAERFDVRHLERVPLGTSYPAVVARVGALLARPPLQDAELVVDDTGVGRAVSEIFETAGLSPVRVSITAGAEQTQVSHSPERWHVAKGILISTLDARLHTGELRFAAELTEAGAMAEELKDFRRKVGVAGRYGYEARVGKHDDLVLAVAIALWRAVESSKAGWSVGHIPF